MQHDLADDDNVVELERPRFIAACDVKVKAVQWLWNQYLPLGKISILEGDPGLAKTTIALDIAARVTAGKPMPDGSACERGSVVFIGYEDDHADTIVPRFRAAGGDDKRFFLLLSVYGPEGPRPITIPDDVEHLRDVVQQVKAKLLIIDPLMAALAGDVKTNVDHHVRRALAPIKELAEENNTAVLFIRHWNKNAQIDNLKYRGGGSIAFTGASRAGFAVAEDPEDPTARLLIPVKNNLAPAIATRPLRYRVVTDEEHQTAAIEWLGAVDAQQIAESMRMKGPADTTAIGEAVAHLHELLANGPVLATEAERYLKGAGCSASTIKRATKKAKVRKRPRKDEHGVPHWWWELPAGTKTSTQGAQS